MDAAQILMALPPVEWERAVAAMPLGKRHDIELDLAVTAKLAAQLSGYLEERYGYGCGDQGHEDAAKEANRAGEKVWRNALGYNSYTPLVLPLRRK